MMQAASRVVVTGASGFIGRHVVRHLAAAGFAVRAVTRTALEHVPEGIENVAAGDLERASEDVLDRITQGAAAIVHLAGRAHVLQERDADPAAAYRGANVDATARLASAALRAGVARFVLASSVKVNGERTLAGRPFRPDDLPQPQDLYGRSKAEAERVVLSTFDSAAASSVVLRLPLVYGPGVKGNFARLVDAIASERTLPIGAIDNRRSVDYIGNVCSAVAAVLAVPVAVRGIHFVADERSVSTPELARELGKAMSLPAHLVYVPVPLLRIAATLAGRRAELDRLTGSLEVDSASLRDAASWRPAHTLQEGLAHTASWWRAHHSI